MPAAEESPELQAAFICEAAKYPAHAFVWIDEVRCDRRNANRLYGRSLRGLPARRHGYFLRGNRYSSIGMMCSERWLGQLTVAGPTNSADLCFFGQHYLLPNMNKFDPDNIAPRSILVLDNCNAHYNIDFHRMMHEAGVKVMFLPPYSPTFNPIENAFSKVKSWLRRNHRKVLLAGHTDLDAVDLAFESISNEDCFGYAKNAGYVFD